VFKPSKKNLIHAAAILAAVFLLSAVLPALRPYALNVLRFPFSIFSFAGREAVGMITYHRNMVERQGLEQEIASLRQQVKSLDEIAFENRRLQNLLGFREQNRQRTVAARVIARAPDNWLSVIIVDKGSSTGVRRNAVVITPAGLLGRVVDTSPNLSKVALVNDPDFSVSAIVQRSRQEGLVSGTLGTSLIMKYLPRESDVKVDDVVVTSGLTGICPKGILVGKVTSIGEEFSGLSHYAIIRPSVNLSNVEEVLIIIP
jgi:rod shape-determining protein MreC